MSCSMENQRRRGNNSPPAAAPRADGGPEEADTAIDTYPKLSFKAHCSPVRQYAMDTYPRRIRIRYVSDTGYVVSRTYRGITGRY